MHWPSLDHTTWAFIISIVTLLLTVPLTILGNILTPKVQNWWAQLSKRGLTNRIEALEKRLKSSEGFPLWSHFEIIVLFSLGMIASMIQVIGIVVGLFLVFVLGQHNPYEVLVGDAAIYLLFFRLQKKFVAAITDAYLFGHTGWRDKTKKSIEALRAQLESKK